MKLFTVLGACMKSEPDIWEFIYVPQNLNIWTSSKGSDF